jgi:hypothetical protein
MILDGYINKNLNSLEFHYAVADGPKNIALVSLSFIRGNGDNFTTSIHFFVSHVYEQETFIFILVVWIIVLIYFWRRLWLNIKKSIRKHNVYTIWYQNEIKHKFRIFAIGERLKKGSEFFRMAYYINTFKNLSIVIQLCLWIVVGFSIFE